MSSGDVHWFYQNLVGFRDVLFYTHMFDGVPDIIDDLFLPYFLYLTVINVRHKSLVPKV